MNETMSRLPESMHLGPLRFRRFYGNDERGLWAPYLSKLTLRFGKWSIGVHKFHRGDADPDCHDHPFDFWTFPLTSYVEEVVERDATGVPWRKRRYVVRAFRIHYRPATYTHRVLGRYDEQATLEYAKSAFPVGAIAQPFYMKGKCYTLVAKRDAGREWGFLKLRNGDWCWLHWNAYINAGGKDTGCNE